MIVSTFEVFGQLNSGYSQEYFLTISNLEDRTIKTGLTIIITNNTGNRAITSANIKIAINNGGSENPALEFSSITSGRIITLTTNPFKIPAFQTYQVVLSTTPPNQPKIRGYISLNNHDGRPNTVLISPEHKGHSYRIVAIQETGPLGITTSSFNEDSAFSYSVPISSGKAENIIQP